jgi:O-antigen ligase
MDAAPEPSGGAPGAGAIVLAGLAGAVLLGSAFAGDGSGVGGILPVGGAAVLLLGAALVAVALGRLTAPRVGRSGAALVAATVALVAWTGVTVVWSILPDRSWDAFNRGVAFAAFLGLGIVVAGVAGRVAARVGASLLALVTGAVLAWALLAKSIPSLDPEGDRVARLREPVGYWNALALLADVAIVLGLWLGASRGHRAVVRVAGALLTYAATLALLLTLSRAGLVAGVVVVALWLLLSSERLDGGVVLVVAAGPAALVGAWAFTRPALVEDVAVRSDREADGAVLGALALVGAAAVALLVVLAVPRLLRSDAQRRVGRVLALVGVVVVLLAGALVVVGGVHAVSQGRDCAEVVNDPGRFGSLESARVCWWGEAWDVFAGQAPEGAGAGSFEVARKRYRVDARNVLQPHSVPLQQLADGGVVALVLFLALVGAAGAVCVCALRRLAGDERTAAVALLAAPVAYLLHALVDYSWDFLAVTAPTMVALGALAAAGRPRGVPVRRPLLGVGAILVALAVLVSFSSPRLAERTVRASTRALDEGDLDRAHDRARWGHRLNPLSAEPLLALGRVEERRGRPDAAEERYVQAVELQPENPETWYALGLFEFEARERMCAAYRFLNEAYTLDPSGSQWFPGGPLDVARDAVNAGACESG